MTTGFVLAGKPACAVGPAIQCFTSMALTVSQAPEITYMYGYILQHTIIIYILIIHKNNNNDDDDDDDDDDNNDNSNNIFFFIEGNTLNYYNEHFTLIYTVAFKPSSRSYVYCFSLEQFANKQLRICYSEIREDIECVIRNAKGCVTENHHQLYLVAVAIREMFERGECVSRYGDPLCATPSLLALGYLITGPVKYKPALCR